ncbi:MAG: leucine--tRNA ligase [Cyclobacteriaceae bacterium]|nr:leucine--tRNA ligase [Cyclobacteriaceae bacterium]
MSVYNFKEIEPKWQEIWNKSEIYKAKVDPEKPKFYSLDMFPYPSGSGLHVGHPLGYIASDIVSRFKRLQGYNVLHPMGFDAFGLPAEQYAIQTGQHPAITTEQNIARYKEQLKNIGFSFDWSTEVQTCDPDYYKWTQWITIELFNSWYDLNTDKARPVSELIEILKNEGNSNLSATCSENTPIIDAGTWKAYSEKEKSDFLLNYRLAYRADTTVNWCPALGTVLSNDEVKDGFSERGGHPVERKVMPQWNLRISAYADRLLSGLDKIDWPEPMKEMQRNWIGKSIGAEFYFEVENREELIHVFTTRIDTIYGVTFVSIAPESELVDVLTTEEHRNEVEKYVEVARNRSERERMSEVKKVSGVFTGSYAIHPFSGAKVPIWVADYVLAGYGTGAVMAVPAGDQRDYLFAKHFNLPITPIIEGANIEEEADPTKEGKMINSGILNGLGYEEATKTAIDKLRELGIGNAKVQYRMRDAIYARQRYWGEPFPVYYKDGMPIPVPFEDLPLELPSIDEYKPTETGEPPLGRAKDWKFKGKYDYELSTMPGWAGSSWYFFRYMDAKNPNEFVSKGAQEYWKNVDLYIGGSEHATGHLLYSRFWTKFLYDMGYVTVDEPFKKLINQGMIQGRSNFVYAARTSFHNVHPDFKHIALPEIYISKNLRDQMLDHQKHIETYEYIESIVDYQIDKLNKQYPGLNLTIENLDLKAISAIHVDVSLVRNDILDVEAFKEWRPHLKDAIIIPERSGEYICGWEIEKMSKSKYNVVNPDDMIEQYGADTLRLYEMFLGPIEQFKPWNTNGVDGVYKFLKKYWNLFHKDGQFAVSDNEPSRESLKTLHKTIKKVHDDIENLSLNTSVSAFMICVNELTAQNCNNRKVLEELTIILSPFAPHIAEEIWHKLGHKDSINRASYPAYNEEYLKEADFDYPIMVNGKMRAKITFGMDVPKDQIEAEVLANETVQKWTGGKTPKKVIVVPKKIVNVVV